MRYVLDAVSDVNGKVQYVAIKDTDTDSIQVYSADVPIMEEALGKVYGQNYTWVELIEKSNIAGGIADIDKDGLLGYSEECGWEYFSVVEPADFKAYKNVYLKYAFNSNWFSYCMNTYNSLTPYLRLHDRSICHLYINQKMGIALHYDTKYEVVRAVTLNELTGYSEPQPYEAEFIEFPYSVLGILSYMRFVLKEGHLYVNEIEGETYIINLQKDQLFHCEALNGCCQSIAYDANTDLPVPYIVDSTSQEPKVIKYYDVVAIQPNGIGLAHSKKSDTDLAYVRKILYPLHLSDEECYGLADNTCLDRGIGAYIWIGDNKTKFNSSDGTLTYTERIILNNGMQKSRYILKRGKNGKAYCFDRASGTKATKEQLKLIGQPKNISAYLTEVENLQELIKKNLPQDNQEFVRHLVFQSMFLGQNLRYKPSSSTPDGFIIAKFDDMMHWAGGSEIIERILYVYGSDWLLCVSGDNICWVKEKSYGILSINIASVPYEFADGFNDINDLGVENLDNFVEYPSFLHDIWNRR